MPSQSSISSVARPHTTVVLAMSADGKIADVGRSPARFGSAADKRHLEQQIAQADAVMFGAGTLRAYGTTLPITQRALLDHRQQQGKPPQPIHIVCSASGQLDPRYPFFRQAVPRWLLTFSPIPEPAAGFDHIITVQQTDQGMDWPSALADVHQAGIERLVVCGGGQLVASLVAVGAIDEVWLTLCPLFLGGQTAPTPVEGQGFLADQAPRLRLLSAQVVEHEVFLHYSVAK